MCIEITAVDDEARRAFDKADTPRTPTTAAPPPPAPSDPPLTASSFPHPPPPKEASPREAEACGASEVEQVGSVWQSLLSPSDDQLDDYVTHITAHQLR